MITSEPQTDVKTYSYFLDNQSRNAENDKTFEVHEPYSGKLFARVAAGSRADARVAVDAAAKAFPAWADSTPAEKARLFLKASEIVRRRRDEIANILARETGSTISFSTFQMDPQMIPPWCQFWCQFCFQLGATPCKVVRK